MPVWTPFSTVAEGKELGIGPEISLGLLSSFPPSPPPPPPPPTHPTPSLPFFSFIFFFFFLSFYNGSVMRMHKPKVPSAEIPRVIKASLLHGIGAIKLCGIWVCYTDSLLEEISQRLHLQRLLAWHKHELSYILFHDI